MLGHRPGAHEPARNCSSWTSRRWGSPRPGEGDLRHHPNDSNAEGVTILLVEQNARMALGISAHGSDPGKRPLRDEGQGPGPHGRTRT